MVDIAVLDGGDTRRALRQVLSSVLMTLIAEPGVAYASAGESELDGNPVTRWWGWTGRVRITLVPNLGATLHVDIGDGKTAQVRA